MSIKTLTMNDYQKEALTTANYPGRIIYPALGLCGEVGEIAEKIKKAVRDHNCKISYSYRELIKKELGDVLWFIATLAHDIGFTLEEVARTQSFNMFQYTTIALNRYHNNIIFHVFSLTMKARIIVNTINNAKKYYRGRVVLSHKNTIKNELAGAMRQLAAISYLLNFTLKDVANTNIAKLASRKERNKINGNGDNR